MNEILLDVVKQEVAKALANVCPGGYKIEFVDLGGGRLKIVAKKPKKGLFTKEVSEGIGILRLPTEKGGDWVFDYPAGRLALVSLIRGVLEKHGGGKMSDHFVRQLS